MCLFNSKNISQYYCLCCILNQINIFLFQNWQCKCLKLKCTFISMLALKKRNIWCLFFFGFFIDIFVWSSAYWLFYQLLDHGKCVHCTWFGYIQEIFNMQQMHFYGDYLESVCCCCPGLFCGQVPGSLYQHQPVPRAPPAAPTWTDAWLGYKRTPACHPSTPHT